MSDVPTVAFSLRRLPVSTRDRLTALAMYLTVRASGVRIPVEDVAAEALARGLDVMEAEIRAALNGKLDKHP